MKLKQIVGLAGRYTASDMGITLVIALATCCFIWALQVATIVSSTSDFVANQRNPGFELVAGANGDPLRLSIHSMYNVLQLRDGLTQSEYYAVKESRGVKHAVPFLSGETVNSFGLLGTSRPEFLAWLSEKYAVDVPRDQVMCVAGAATGMSVGDVHEVNHHHHEAMEHNHSHSHSHCEHDQNIRVSAVLPPTGTWLDYRVICDAEILWHQHYDEWVHMFEESGESAPPMSDDFRVYSWVGVSVANPVLTDRIRQVFDVNSMHLVSTTQELRDIESAVQSVSAFTTYFDWLVALAAVLCTLLLLLLIRKSLVLRLLSLVLRGVGRRASTTVLSFTVMLQVLLGALVFVASFFGLMWITEGADSQWLGSWATIGGIAIAQNTVLVLAAILITSSLFLYLSVRKTSFDEFV